MNHHPLLLGLALLLSPVLLLAEEALKLSQAQIDALGLRFEQPATADAASGPAWSGTVTLPPDGHELVVAPLAGRIVRVHASSGDAVTAGQALFTLYSPALVQLAQDYQQARAGEDLARQTLAREQRLLKEGIGIERRVREAEIAVRQASTQTRGLGARLALAGIATRSLAEGSAVSAEITLKAPRDGQLLRLDVLPGTWLDEGEAAAELGYTRDRWIETDVPAEQAASLRPGQAARVQPGELTGRVLAIGPTVDARLQTLAVRVGIEKAEALRPGQRVQVRFAEAGQVWRVSSSAMVRIEARDMLFVQRGAVLQPLPIQVREHNADAALVSAELRPGDRVVIQGAIALKAAWQAAEQNPGETQ
ncbi:MAG: efflux RND transporter periplasmic adaptor subunit [Pseudomonadota bacterium]